MNHCNSLLFYNHVIYKYLTFILILLLLTSILFDDIYWILLISLFNNLDDILNMQKSKKMIKKSQNKIISIENFEIVVIIIKIIIKTKKHKLN